MMAKKACRPEAGIASLLVMLPFRRIASLLALGCQGLLAADDASPNHRFSQKYSRCSIVFFVLLKQHAYLEMEYSSLRTGVHDDVRCGSLSLLQAEFASPVMKSTMSFAPQFTSEFCHVPNECLVGSWWRCGHSGARPR